MVQISTSTGLVKHDKKHRLKQRFEVKHKLGQGTYGKVQLAINKETGQEVAIKTIKKSKIQTEQDLVRIRREIQIMSSIQHPHIIHIYEVFENKEKIVLVMQYASGGELYEYVSDRKVLSDNEARRLFRQIATAVYYCHKNKVCHRDLKLENILLDHNGNAKIADFGLSNVFDEKHFLNTFCGSPLYASPEIVKGIPYYGAEVDCWSLGVLLYTLVYGAMPFDGSNFKRMVKQISESSYYEPKQKSEAAGLIRRLLTVEPTKRATIIDICTDWWVNKGYEHSLLQVAEDLANLTPVRLDVLLALAPISPPAENQPKSQHPLSGPDGVPVGEGKDAIKRVRSKVSRSDEALYPPSGVGVASDYQADTSELSTDIPTYAEEEEEELAGANEIVDDGDEFLPSAIAVAPQDECQETLGKREEPKAGSSQTPSSLVGDDSSEPSKSAKRMAGASFERKERSILNKRKKPKKVNDEAGTTESEDKPISSSGYMSDGTSVTGATFPTSQVITEDLTQSMDQTTEDDNNTIRGDLDEDDETMLNKSTVICDSLPDVTSISSQISSPPETRENSKTDLSLSATSTTATTQSSASTETLTAKGSPASPSECETSSASTLVEEPSFSGEKSSSSVKSASPKRPVTSKASCPSASSSSSTVITGKQSTTSLSPTTTTLSAVSSKSLSDKRTKSSEKVSRTSAKESPPKVIKGKTSEGSAKIPSSPTSVSPSTSTTTTASTSTVTAKDTPPMPASRSGSISEAGDSVPTTPDTEKTKPWLERRESVNRKVGKISYPKFLENTSAPEKKPVPTYGKISTAKKMFETRRASIDKDKERVIPMVKVSDAKQAFERRASMPATQAPLWKNAGERKASLMQQSSLDETVSTEQRKVLSKDRSPEKSTTSSRAATRPRKSSSSPVKSRSPNKSPVKMIPRQSANEASPPKDEKSEVKPENMKPTREPSVKLKSKTLNGKSNETKRENVQKLGTSKGDAIKPSTEPVADMVNDSNEIRSENDQKVSRLAESPSQLDNEEERKVAAKDMIKKQIAKAKLQQLRQSSIESHESNLSGSSDQQVPTATTESKLPCQGGGKTTSEESVSPGKPKSYAKAPQPFVKEGIKPTPVRSVAEIKLSSKPKLGLDIEAAHRDQQQKQPRQLEEVLPTNIVEPPSTAGTILNQESNPGTPSTATTLSKAAPITRSYKKVTFTKDGACITETGKIISEEGADGSFSRIEKKSKVTHYPGGTGSVASNTRSESSEETRTLKSGTGDSFDESRSGSISPPAVRSISGLRRSESASSSGSTDIFDDIFDTWSGDPVFSNISGRMRSMLSSSRSPFSSLWGTGRNKKSKKKSRAESAERKSTAETGLSGSRGWRRVPGHGTDQEFSDTDTDNENSMGFSGSGGGGLWKFLGPTPSSSNLIDRHRSLLSRHFGSNDFFTEAEPFSSSFRRSLSRDRGSTSFGPGSRDSSANVTPTVRMVINPLRAASHHRTPVNRMTSTPSKQDSLDSNESGGSTTQNVTTTTFSSKPVTGRPYSRTISRETQRQPQREVGLEEGTSSSFDLDNDRSVTGPSSRRRVEQWLDMSRDNEEIGANHPISMYTTIRPRPINRYGRSVSSRFDLGSGADSPRETFQNPSSGSNLSFNTTQEIQIGTPTESPAPRPSTAKPRSEVIIPVGRTGSPLISMNVSLGGGNEPREVRTFITSTGVGGNSGGVGGRGGVGIELPISTDSLGGSDWSNSILLPESSSLLDQLRTHGYRNLVTQRLSGLSGTPSRVGGESRYDNRDSSCVSTSTTTNTTSTTTPTTTPPNTTTTTTSNNLPPQQMKRGKSLTGDSSSTRNLENLIVNDNDGHTAWSLPVNGQPKIINHPNNQSMSNPIRPETRTNFNARNSVNLNRTVHFVDGSPVDGVGVVDGKINDIQDDDLGSSSLHGSGDYMIDGEKVQSAQRTRKGSLTHSTINSDSGEINCNPVQDCNNANHNQNSSLDHQGRANRGETYHFTSLKTVTSLPPKPKTVQTIEIELTNQGVNQSYHRHNQTDQLPFHLHPKSNQRQIIVDRETHNMTNNHRNNNQLPSKSQLIHLNRESDQPEQKPPRNLQQSPPPEQQFNEINCNNNHHLPRKTDHPHLNDANEDDKEITFDNRKKRNNNSDDNSDDPHRSLNNPNCLYSTTNLTNDPNHKETLQERILRKSYYSRFNHPLERRSSPARRRISLIENGDRLLDFSLFDQFSRPYHPSMASPLATSAPATSSPSHHHSKPPFFLTNDQFIERVQTRAQQLIEEARERHARINSQLSSFRPINLTHGTDEEDFLGSHFFHQPSQPRTRNHSSSSHIFSSSSSSSSHPHNYSQRSREPSPFTSLNRTNSLTSGSDEFYLINKSSSRRPSSTSTSTTISTTTPFKNMITPTNRSSIDTTTSNRTSSSYHTARTSSTRPLSNGHSQIDDDPNDDEFDDLDSHPLNGDAARFDSDNLGDDLTTRAQNVSKALKILKDRALQEN